MKIFLLFVLYMISSLSIANWDNWQKKQSNNKWNEPIVGQYALSTSSPKGTKNFKEYIMVGKTDESVVLWYIHSAENLFNTQIKILEFKVDSNEPIKIQCVLLSSTVAASSDKDKNLLKLISQMRNGKILKIIVPSNNLKEINNLIEIPLNNFGKAYKETYVK